MTTDNLLISERVHIVFPWHIIEDKLLNAKKIKGESIGTTLRGIGPCYRDKVGRSFAIRLGDMYRDDFADRVRSIVEAKNAILIGIGGADAEHLEAEPIITEYSGYAETLKSYVHDTTHFMLDAVAPRPAVFCSKVLKRKIVGYRPWYVSICNKQQQFWSWDLRWFWDSRSPYQQSHWCHQSLQYSSRRRSVSDGTG